MSKTLVAYFSASGVTKELAQTLAKVAEADIYEIAPVDPYTTEDLNWMDETSRSSLEKKHPEFRPEIAREVKDMGQYDTVFVGFPIWWYVAPNIIHTFLENYDFSGKTVIPFATSGGSGMGRTDEVLKESCSKGTKWKSGKKFNGSNENELTKWIQSLGL